MQRKETSGATDADFERETVIQFDDGHAEAVIYTHHYRWQKRLHDLGLEPVEVSERRGRKAAMTFHVPVRWLQLPVPRTHSISDEERQKRSRHMAAYNRSRAMNNTSGGGEVEQGDGKISPK